MKFNSVHKFDNLADANVFVEHIRGAGFTYVGIDKDGGVIYSDTTHTLMVCAYGV